MKQLLSNNFETTLTAPIGTTDTACSLADASGMNNPGTNEYEIITFNDGVNVENVNVLTRIGNLVTSMVRNADGGGAHSFATGTPATGESGVKTLLRLSTNVKYVNAQTGTTYTTVLDDVGALVTMNNAGANSITVPPNSSVAYETNASILISGIGAGVTTVVEGAGVTIHSPRSLVLRKQYSTVRLIQIATDEWLMIENGTQLESLVIPIGDEDTDITTGTAKTTFRLPYGFTLTEVRCNCKVAPTGSTIIIDINEEGTSVLSTKLTIDVSEKTSTTAATPAVISDATLADDAEMTIDVDQIGSTIAGTGLKVTLLGYQT